ncbi:hypothetical protein L208DRAFT_928263 [Tricholoma matsutake]|nr:hypothetical protein L208DRAFT_928263 [Tricholoma matsutake 945]
MCMIFFVFLFFVFCFLFFVFCFCFWWSISHEGRHWDSNKVTAALPARGSDVENHTVSGTSLHHLMWPFWHI